MRAPLHIKNQKDFVSALLCMVAGAWFVWGALGLPFGTAQAMGPGYAPLLLGAALTLLGAILVFKSLVLETEDSGRIGPIAWRAALCIALAVGLFGVLLGGMPVLGLPAAGLMGAVAALTLVVAQARPGWLGVRTALPLALVLALAAWWWLRWSGLPLALWPQLAQLSPQGPLPLLSPLSPA